MKHLLFILLAAFLACGDLTMPLVDPANIRVDFIVTGVAYTDRWDWSASAAMGAIIVRGSFVTAQAGYTLTPELSRRMNGVYVLTITGDLTDLGITVPIHYRYEAVLSGLPAGVYRLEVRHAYAGSERQELVLSDTLVVR
jgi:hypothetical protein